MTTITIERELLKEVVDIFDNAISTRYPHEILRDIRTALAAPATAPEPVACLVETEGGAMVWPIDDIDEAGTYCELDEFPVLLYRATAPEITTDEAVKRLTKALRDDLDYAWGWHCNIAMTAFDAGCPHDVANEGAARFMQLLAGVDTRKHPGFAGTQLNVLDSRHAQELLAQEITIANMRERHAQELCAYEVTADKLRAERKPMGTADRVRAFQAAPDPVSCEDFMRGIDAAEAHHGIGEKT